MTRGSGLLALLLYVIPSTWTEITRPAYSSLLRFPMTWTVPPAIRAAAIEKADHLGLGYLAAEVEAQDAAGEGPATTTSTGFLRLREALGPSRAMKPEQAGAIRLHHLTEDFYSNLDQLRDDKRYCLRDDRPSALDFLVFGYLQLMRAQPHHPSLKPELEDRVEDLLARVDTLRQKQALPWREPSPKSLANTLGRFADGALGHTPVAGNSWRRWRIGGIRNAGEEEEEAKNATHMILAAGGAVLGLAAVGAALLFRGLAPLGAPTHRFEPTRKEEGSRLNQFGEIGAILDGLPVWGPSQG
ncbi:hypothetical protein F4778DRAFT_750896 [Xylariomycetidae sp. FL2044]|nr:hypothetical protein F4778DRAFT_750896 [Xylariomycetidae sp. FL2044]